MRGNGAIDCGGRGRRRGASTNRRKGKREQRHWTLAFPLPFYLYTWSLWFKPTILLLLGPVLNPLSRWAGPAGDCGPLYKPWQNHSPRVKRKRCFSFLFVGLGPPCKRGGSSATNRHCTAHQALRYLLTHVASHSIRTRKRSLSSVEDLDSPVQRPSSWLAC